MRYTFDFGGEPQDLTIVISGHATPLDLHRLNDDLRSDRRFRAGLVILVDASDLDVSALTLDALEVASAPIAERDAVAPPLAVTIVATDPEVLARAAHYRAFLGGSASHRRAFTSADEATGWLHEQRLVG
jgi:hypothetical protein